MSFVKRWSVLAVFQFPRTYFVGGSFSKMDFRRRPFNQKPLVFRESPRTHLEVQGSSGDEGTFQECQKSWILTIPLFGETENWRPGVYFDAEYVSAHFCRTKTPWIAIWGKIFFFLQKLSFLVFWPFLSKCKTKETNFETPRCWDSKGILVENGRGPNTK